MTHQCRTQRPVVFERFAKLADRATELVDECSVQIGPHRLRLEPRFFAFHVKLDCGIGFQKPLELFENFVGRLARNQPAIDLDAARIRHDVDADAAGDPPDADGRLTQKRVGVVRAQLGTKPFDGGEHARHPIDGVDSPFPASNCGTRGLRS